MSEPLRSLTKREREKERKREASEREEFGRDKEQGKHLV